MRQHPIHSDADLDEFRLKILARRDRLNILILVAIVGVAATAGCLGSGARGGAWPYLTVVLAVAPICAYFLRQQHYDRVQTLHEREWADWNQYLKRRAECESVLSVLIAHPPPLEDEYMTKQRAGWERELTEAASMYSFRVPNGWKNRLLS